MFLNVSYSSRSPTVRVLLSSVWPQRGGGRGIGRFRCGGGKGSGKQRIGVIRV